MNIYTSDSDTFGGNGGINAFEIVLTAMMKTMITTVTTEERKGDCTVDEMYCSE